MSLDPHVHRRQSAHALLDLLPEAKLAAVHDLLELITWQDADGDEESAEERALIQARLDSLDHSTTVPMETVLGDFGLSVEEFEQRIAMPDASR